MLYLVAVFCVKQIKLLKDAGRPVITLGQRMEGGLDQEKMDVLVAGGEILHLQTRFTNPVCSFKCPAEHKLSSVTISWLDRCLDSDWTSVNSRVIGDDCGKSQQN